MIEEKNSKPPANGIIGGTVSLTISTIIVKLLGVIYKVPLARILGEEGMGYFNSAYTVYAFFYLLCTAGVPKAIMILISEAKAKDGGEEKIVNTGMRFFLLLGGAVSLTFIFLSAPLSRLIGSSSSRATMLAIAPSIIFISLAGVIRGYLSANLKLTSIAVSQIIEGASKLVLGLVFANMGVRLGMPLPIISSFTILGVTFGSVFGLIYLIIRSKKQISANKTKQKISKTERNGIIKNIFSISVPITVSASVMSITGIIDLMVIMRRLSALGYSPSESTALYGNYTTMAVPMFNLAISVITPISISFLSVFARANASGNKDLLNKSIKDALGFSMLLSAPLMLGIMIFPQEILTLLYGTAGIKIGAGLMFMLAPGIFLMSLLLIINSALEACGKVKLTVLSMTVGSVTKLIVGYLLMSDERVGIFGAPLSTVACYAVSLGISAYVLTKKCRIELKIFEACMVPHACALPAIISARLLYEHIQSFISYSAALIIAIVYSAAVYFLLARICNVFSTKRLKDVSKYTKLA